jgi:hypothetical protein
MIYLALFYHDDDPERHTTFSLTVKSENVNEAESKFKEKLKELKQHEAFDDAKQIYLDGIFEFGSIPDTPVAIAFRSIALDKTFRGKIGCDLLEDNKDGIIVYGNDDPDDPGPKDIEPFIEF